MSFKHLALRKRSASFSSFIGMDRKRAPHSVTPVKEGDAAKKRISSRFNFRGRPKPRVPVVLDHQNSDIPTFKAIDVTDVGGFDPTRDPENKTNRSRRRMSLVQEKMCRDAFNLFDKDGGGTLQAKELNNVVKTILGEQLSNTEIQEMITEVDVDGDGEVSFEEFLETMSKQMQSGNSGGRWGKLGAFIKAAHEADEIRHTKSTSNGLMGLTAKKQAKMHQKKVISKQHHAMVAHFNLRRLSVDQEHDESADDLQRALNEYNRRKKPWRQRLKEPFDPETKFRRSWDILIMLLVIVQAIYLPYVVAFQPPTGKNMDYFDYLVDAMFISDLLMTFNLAYNESGLENGPLVVDRHLIARNYLKGWFWIDLVSSVPFDTIVEAIIESQQTQVEQKEGDLAILGLLKGLRLPRLLRLLKVMRILRIMKLAKVRPEVIWWLKYSRYSNLLRLGSMFVGIFAITHYMTCVFFALTDSEEMWLAQKECGYPTLQEVQDGVLNVPCSEADIKDKYILAFYTSMLLIQGEEVDPQTPNERAYATFAILLGSVIVANIFGQVSMLIANFHSNTSNYQKKMEYLFESMNHMFLPNNLQQRVHLYYDHLWRQYRSLDGKLDMFIPELNKTLQGEVKLYLRTNLILSVPFLRQCSPDIVHALVTSLQQQLFLPSDYIVHKGVPGEEMYLISKGNCEATVVDVAIDATHRSDGSHASAAIGKKIEKFSTDQNKRGNKRRITTMPANWESGGGKRPTGKTVVDLDSKEEKDPHEGQRDESSSPRAEMREVAQAKLTAAMVQHDTYNPRGKDFVPGEGKESRKRRMSLEGAGRRMSAGATALSKSFRLRGGNKVVDGDEKLKEFQDRSKRRGSLSNLFNASGIIQKLSHNNSQGRKPLFQAEKVIKVLEQGHYFGEIALIFNCKRTCNVRAKGFAELCILSRDHFESVVSKFDHEKKLIEQLVLAKYQQEAHSWELQKNVQMKEEQATLVNVCKTQGAIRRKCDDMAAEQTSFQHNQTEIMEAVMERLGSITQALGSVGIAVTPPPKLPNWWRPSNQDEEPPAFGDIDFDNVAHALMKEEEGGGVSRGGKEESGEARAAEDVTPNRRISAVQRVEEEMGSRQSSSKSSDKTFFR